jgi:hypothetical protein
MSVTHHCQNPLECICSKQCLSLMFAFYIIFLFWCVACYRHIAWHSAISNNFSLHIHMYACNNMTLNFEGILHLSPVLKFVAGIWYWYAVDNDDSHVMFYDHDFTNSIQFYGPDFTTFLKPFQLIDGASETDWTFKNIPFYIHWNENTLTLTIITICFLSPLTIREFILNSLSCTSRESFDLNFLQIMCLHLQWSPMIV